MGALNLYSTGISASFQATSSTRRSQVGADRASARVRAAAVSAGSGPAHEADDLGLPRPGLAQRLCRSARRVGDDVRPVEGDDPLG